MTTRRRRLAPLAAIALLPAVSALLLVRPAPAVGQAADVGLFSMTVLAAGTNTTGTLGAGGGLAPIDSGTPVVRGRLDSSPSASVLAAPVEPGTLFRTAAALANNEVPDQEPLAVPAAQSAHPGGPAKDQVSASGQAGDAPVTSTVAAARTSAGEHAIGGEAEAAAQDLTGDGALVRQSQVRTSASATASPQDGQLLATATSSVSSVTIADTVTFEDVTGRASLRYADGAVTAEAGTTFGAVTVAGTPVRLTDEGVVLADDAGPALPTGQAATAEDQVNAALEAAGVTIEPLSPVREGGDRAGRADSGGVKVSVTTPSSAAVPANAIEVVIGQAAVTMSTEPAPEPAPLPSAPTTTDPQTLPDSGAVDAAPPPSSPGPAVAPPTTSDTAAPDTGAPSPEVAPAEEPQVLVAGRRIPQRTALALLGGWQLLSLSTCTLAAFALPGGRGRP